MAATRLANCIICDKKFENGKRGNPKQVCSEECRKKRKRSYEKSYYRTNIDIRRIQKLKTRKKLKEEVIELLGGKCCQCGEFDIRCLQIDHIHGGGGKERKSLSVWKYYKKVLKSVKNNGGEYQCLCANCNFKKRNDKGQLI
jgi:hypothetical protein